MSDSMNTFFWGATAMASWAVGLIFLHSWRFTADRFFALFRSGVLDFVDALGCSGRR